jgi:hypothetical protein
MPRPLDGDDPTHLARPPGPPANDLRRLDLCREVAPMRFRVDDLRPHGWGSGRVSQSFPSGGAEWA